MDKKSSEQELDCSKKCKHIVSDCLSSGKDADSCRNRYNACVAACAFA